MTTSSATNLVHVHTLVNATVAREASDIRCDELREFLSGLIKAIEMQALFEPIALQGKYGFTGVAGIVTSHIAFHYFTENRMLQLDVYSCKEYDVSKLMETISEYWSITKAEILVVDRAKRFVTRHYSHDGRVLRKRLPRLSTERA